MKLQRKYDRKAKPGKKKIQMEAEKMPDERRMARLCHKSTPYSRLYPSVIATAFQALFIFIYLGHIKTERN